MSLKIFHYAFISISTLLGAGLTYWGLVVDPNVRWLSVVGIAMIVILIPYVRWFQNKMKRLGQGN